MLMDGLLDGGYGTTPESGGSWIGMEMPDRSLALEDFLPHRLSVLNSAIGRPLARICEQQFGVSIGEWCLMVNLARLGPMAANGLCSRCAMDKVQVSRAVARAVDHGLIQRTIDHGDRRRALLSLTERGHAIHDQIAALAQHYQDYLQEALSVQERSQFDNMLERLLTRAGQPQRFVS